MLTTILDPSNAGTQLSRGERNQEILGIEFAASAEASSDIDLDQIDGGLVQSKHGSQNAAIEERYLGCAMDSHMSERVIPHREEAAGLHRGSGMALDVQSLPAGVIRSCEGILHIIADAGGEDRREVGPGLLEQQRLIACGNGTVRDRGQAIDLEPDALQCVLGDRWVGCNDDSDRFADITNLAGGDHGLPVWLAIGNGMLADRNNRHLADIAAVTTAVAPGSPRAAEISISRMNPCEIGLRRTAA